MSSRIFDKLDPVRRRQRRLSLWRGASLGLLASSLAGIALGIARWRGVELLDQPWVVGLLAAGAMVGGLVGMVRFRGWSRAAQAVDAHYQLKDRAVSAVDFVQRPGATVLHELQLTDAEQHLGQVDARRVVPFRMPTPLPWALATSALALTLLLWPRPQVQAKPVAPLDQVVAAAEDVRLGVEELEQVAEKEQDEELKRLVQALVEKIEAMKQPGVDLKEALATLSEMQAAIAEQQALYNVGLVDANMKSLGAALASTQAFEAAGGSLQQEQYDKAARQLDQANPQVDRKEAKALKDELKKVSKAMGEAGLGELSEATAELAKSLEDGQECQGACQKLGGLAKAQGRRKQINDLLSLQCQNLSECKGNCNKNGTKTGLKLSKSTSPKNSYGMMTSGNVDGDPTKLDASRRQEVVKGQMAEGPSETESTHSPDGRQEAARAYREQYQKYRRMSEAALNNEPIPLGHRQTIRRYFELIRPENDEGNPPASE